MSKCKSWLMNWLKLQQKGGGVEPTGTISITQNGEHNVKDYATANVNVPADFSEYFDNRAFGNASGKDFTATNYIVKKLPENMIVPDWCTTMYYAFAFMKGLITATYFDTSTITSMRYMFNNCTELRDVPVYDTSNLATTNKNMENMFAGCNKLSDESLDNILQMCINAPAGMPGRNLASIGFVSTYYPTSKIESLPHYTEFLASNWTIGY